MPTQAGRHKERGATVQNRGEPMSQWCLGFCALGLMLGGGNPGLSGSGRPTNSPVRSRRAAISLACKQPTTRPRVGTKSRSDQISDVDSLLLVHNLGQVNSDVTGLFCSRGNSLSQVSGRKESRSHQGRKLSYFFTGGGKFFRSFVTALVILFCRFSGFAFISRVLVAVPRHTTLFFETSYISKTNSPM